MTRKERIFKDPDIPGDKPPRRSRLLGRVCLTNIQIRILICVLYIGVMGVATIGLLYTIADDANTSTTDTVSDITIRYSGGNISVAYAPVVPPRSMIVRVLTQTSEMSRGSPLIEREYVEFPLNGTLDMRAWKNTALQVVTEEHYDDELRYHYWTVRAVTEDVALIF